MIRESIQADGNGENGAACAEDESNDEEQAHQLATNWTPEYSCHIDDGF